MIFFFQLSKISQETLIYRNHVIYYVSEPHKLIFKLVFGGVKFTNYKNLS